MSAELADIATRLLQLARDLAQNAGLPGGVDPLKDKLSQLLAVPADGAARLSQALDAAKKPVQDQFAKLQSQAADLVTGVQNELANATTQLPKELQKIEETLRQSTQEADQAIAAAQRAKEQAVAAIGDAATDAADRARAQADATLAAATAKANQLKDQANAAATAAKEKANAVVADAQKRLDDAKAEAAALPAKLQAELTALEAKVQQEVANAVAQVQQLPDQAIALAEDQLHALEAALTWPAGILSIVAKVLRELKRRFFAAEQRLQVVSFSTAGKLGLGLQWIDGADEFLVVYFADHPTPSGSLRVSTKSATNGPITVSAGGISIKVNGAGQQGVAIGAGTDALGLGTADTAAEVTLDFLTWGPDFEIVAAGVAAPIVRLQLHHDSAWHYSFTAEFPDYHLTLRPSKVLQAAGIPIPLPVPDLEEKRHVRLVIEDGKLDLHEGAAA